MSSKERREHPDCELSDVRVGWSNFKRKRRFVMGILGVLVLVILLVYFVLPAVGEGRGRYSPRHGWGGPSLVSLLVVILIICLIFRVVPVIW
jgi:hypothetical protein